MESEAYRSQVREYYDTYYTPEVLKPRTFQFGLLAGDPWEALTPTNLVQARRAGIEPGQRLLDAGCGICGPSIDIARSIPDVSIDAVTLSPKQAHYGRLAVREAGLEDRIRVHEGDFHALSFPDDTFDRVFFFESFCYAFTREAVLAEVYRVLKPGGELYIKDMFRPPGELSGADQAEFDRRCQAYVARMSTLSETAAAAAAVGFTDVRTQDLAELTEARFRDSRGIRQVIELLCVDYSRGIPLLTPFGKRHLPSKSRLTTVLGEVRGRKPGA